MNLTNPSQWTVPDLIERCSAVAKCDAEQIGSERVAEVFQDQSVWDGTAEVFTVTGHARAKKAYARSQHQGTPQKRFSALLRNLPVRSAVDAIRVSIVKAVKLES
jgi:hypothetical protein